MEAESETEHSIQQSIRRLLNYCQRNSWSGFDPFDGLNSRIFQALPLFQNRISKLIFIQAMKRSPLNFRRIFFVSKGENPKGLAVFSSALFILSRIGLVNNDDQMLHLLNHMIEHKSPNSPYFCWGYNFDWQNRLFFHAKFVPNIICTTFAGNALIDAYDKYKDSKYLDMAISAGDFLLNGLNITKGNGEICFSYTPHDWGHVHNANLLGAAFLSRLYSITGEKEYVGPAFSAVRYSINRQNEDGSWPYGEDKTQTWIDNFHTGYNLVALKRFSEFTKTADMERNIRKGFKFYKENLFTPDGLTKYYHNQLYPIDIHAIAQSIITLTEFKDLDDTNIELAKHICTWAIQNMQSKTGYFYYQKKRFYRNRIPYMRWSQAWMLLAFSTFLEHSKQAETDT